MITAPQKECSTLQRLDRELLIYGQNHRKTKISQKNWLLSIKHESSHLWSGELWRRENCCPCCCRISNWWSSLISSTCPEVIWISYKCQRVGGPIFRKETSLSPICAIKLHIVAVLTDEKPAIIHIFSIHVQIKQFGKKEEIHEYW